MAPTNGRSRCAARPAARPPLIATDNIDLRRAGRLLVRRQAAVRLPSIGVPAHRLPQVSQRLNSYLLVGALARDRLTPLRCSGRTGSLSSRTASWHLRHVLWPAPVLSPTGPASSVGSVGSAPPPACSPVRGRCAPSPPTCGRSSDLGVRCGRCGPPVNLTEVVAGTYGRNARLIHFARAQRREICARTSYPQENQANDFIGQIVAVSTTC